MPSSLSAADLSASGVKGQGLAAALLLALLILQYQLWLAEDGVRQTYALRVANQAQTEENAALNERNRALEADVVDLKSGLMAIEERARSEMGMIRPDETFYRILEQPAPQAKPAILPAKPPSPLRKAPVSAKPPAVVAKPAAAKPAEAKPAAKPAEAKPAAKPAEAKPAAAKPSPSSAQAH